MEVKVTKSQVNISERQHRYIEKKVMRLKKIAGRFWNPATKVAIEFKDNSGGAMQEEIGGSMKMPLPGSTLYANSKGKTVESAIDVLEEKMIQQIDKYKGKREKRVIKEDVVGRRTIERKTGNEEIFVDNI